MSPFGRPTVAFALGLVGGILIIVGGGIFALAWWTFTLFAVIGVVLGIVVVIASIMMYAQPKDHVAWGLIVLLFSAFSIISFGGFIAGMALGIVGGALGMAWGTPRPSPYVAAAPYAVYPGPVAAPYAAPAAPPYGFAAPAMPMGPWGVPVMQWRMCTGCGRWIPWIQNVCPMCGTEAPVASWASPAAPPSPAGAATPVPSAPAAEAPAPLRAPCPTCDGEAEWLPLHSKWFCPRESRYF